MQTLRAVQPLCNIGTLKAPDYSDLYNGLLVEVWSQIKVSFNQNPVDTFLVKIGRFNAVIRRDSLTDIVENDYYWEVNFIIDSAKQNVLSAEQANGTVSSKTDAFTHTACMRTLPYCLSVYASKKHLIESYRFNSLLIFSFFVLTLIFAYFQLMRVLSIRRSPVHRIIKGIKKENFYCRYQAISRLKTTEIIGCESLARFKDKYGSISPNEFIPIIKQKKLTWEFTEVILKCIKQDIELNKDRFVDLKINVNFFPADISQGKLNDYLANYGFNQGNISMTVEVTEEEDLNIEQSESIFKQIVSAGYEIAIDDFGTGYSNLNKLQLLQCSYLKIDRSFIDKMESGKVLSKLIPHFVKIADSINATVVAEGIENEDQLQAVIDQGIELGQGFLISKPTSFAKFTELL